MLVGAIGCNLAWGVIDAILYLMGCLAERGRKLATLQALRKATDPQKGQRILARALPPLVASVLQPAELETMRSRLIQLPEPDSPARLSRTDWLGGLAVFLLVFMSTFPVAVPFLFIRNAVTATRVSNAIAIIMLFIAGFAYGRVVGRSPRAFGLVMVVLGAVLVVLTIALGG
jgi:VIT1/CCC1 family predicted Fe2+/Mn2+ transporter